jgi:hypothetical protein
MASQQLPKGAPMRVTFIPAESVFVLTRSQRATVDYLARIGERDGAHSLIVEAPFADQVDAPWRVDMIGGAAVDYEATTWSMDAAGELAIR